MNQKSDWPEALIEITRLITATFLQYVEKKENSKVKELEAKVSELYKAKVF